MNNIWYIWCEGSILFYTTPPFKKLQFLLKVKISTLNSTEFRIGYGEVTELQNYKTTKHQIKRLRESPLGTGRSCEGGTTVIGTGRRGSKVVRPQG